MPNTVRPDQSTKLARLERKRRRLHVTVEDLAIRAGFRVWKLYRIRRLKRCSRTDIRKLTFALRAIEREQRAGREAFTGGTSLQAAAEVAFAGFLAAATGRISEEHVRKVALYLLVAGCNVQSTTAARVYGCTKQYVSKVMRQIEDLREDPDINQVLQDLERTLS
ncbi:hypothetical protein IWQ51_001719 [Labrenzia sp. EL_142]|nr:hypothetical protein [Labrenzia sp. EL_142]